MWWWWCILHVITRVFFVSICKLVVASRILLYESQIWLFPQFLIRVKSYPILSSQVQWCIGLQNWISVKLTMHNHHNYHHYYQVNTTGVFPISILQSQSHTICTSLTLWKLTLWLWRIFLWLSHFFCSWFTAGKSQKKTIHL